MDDKWFKQQQKKVGVTAEDIAKAIGRDRSLVSRIYVGRQKMTFEQAKAFAKVLEAPLDEILERAGLAPNGDGSYEVRGSLTGGFSEGDAAPYKASAAETDTTKRIAALMGQGPGVDTWTVTSETMRMSGYLPGDTILVDTHQSERAKAGDVVIAQIYDWQTGSAKTVLRRNEPPVLVADGLSQNDQRVLVVDGNNVVIKGKVIAQWRN